MTTYYLQGVSHLRCATAAGMRSRRAFQVVIANFSRVKIQLFFESPESISLVMEQFSRAFLGDGRMVSSPFYQI
jgi:hypothetical protein